VRHPESQSARHPLDKSVSSLYCLVSDWLAPQRKRYGGEDWREGIMRKFIFSGPMLSAIFAGFSTIQASRKGPRDWRLILSWVSWGLTVAIAVGTVIKEADNASAESEDKP
jgi:hypothetical protein